MTYPTVRQLVSALSEVTGQLLLTSAYQDACDGEDPQMLKTVKSAGKLLTEAKENKPLLSLDEADLSNLRTYLFFAQTYITRTMQDDPGRQQYLDESTRLLEKLYEMREQLE